MSYVIAVAELAVLLLPATSVNAPLATDTEPEPLCVFAVGVNTTLYDVPEPLNDDNVPPLNVMSPTAKSVEASDNVMVRVEVSPDFSEAEPAAIETVGACVSYVKVVVELAVLPFPAASVNPPLATDTEPEPVCVFAVGVNTTVYDAPEPLNDDNVPPLAVISVTTKLVDASDSVNVNVDVSPDFNEAEPAAIETVGACVSYAIVVAELAVLLFPAASVNPPLATDTEPEPLCVFAVGVNTTLYDVPEPLNDDNVPPLNVMSPTAKSVEASDNVMVRVEVSPDFSEAEPAAIETVGACVSYVKVVVELAVLPFPAASVNPPLATDTEPEPVCVFAVGVNTTVYDAPEPLNDDNVPPLAVISVTTKLVDASDSVNVNVDVSPDFSVVALAAIETVGTRVS